jgi:hypothetical protein
VYNPWNGQAIVARKTSDNSIVETGSGASLSFPTDPGGVYVVERTAKPLSSFTFTQLTGIPNGSQKTMSYSGKTLTLGAGQGKAPPLSAKPSLVSTIAPIVSSRTMRVAGDRFEFRKFGAKDDYALTVYSLSGKRIRDVIVNKNIVDMRKDIGVSSGVYIVRVTPLR